MTWTRRRFIKAGVVAAGAGLYYLRACHYGRAGAFADVRNLSPRTAAILAAVVEAALPPAADRSDEAIDAHVRAADAQLGSFGPDTVTDMNRLLTLVEQATLPLGCALRRFSSLPLADRVDYLAGFAQSRHDLLRAGLRGLVALVFLVYYRDARAFAPIGYPGPLLPGGGVAGGYDRLVAPAGTTPA